MEKNGNNENTNMALEMNSGDSTDILFSANMIARKKSGRLNLHYGACCKEHCLVRKVYDSVKRVEYCINPGCGYSLKLPDLEKGI